MPTRCCAACLGLATAIGASLSVPAHAQTSAAITTQLAVIQAEERGASAPRDLLTIQNATRSDNIQTVRMAVRALGRIERPAQIPSILPSLRHSLPEVRAEAANAIAQAAQGFRTTSKPAVTTVTIVSTQNS